MLYENICFDNLNSKSYEDKTYNFTRYIIINLRALLFSYIFFSEMYEIDISRWKEEDDNDFVETHNFQAMLEKVNQQPHVIFVGVPGSGKTATVRHIALLLQRKGYDILPIKDIRCIETYCDPKNPQVFVLDDALGIFGLNRIEFDTLKKYECRIREPIMKSTKFLFTCREVVYRNETISTSFLFKKENLVCLQSSENALDNEDKHKLLANYKLNIDILNSEQLTASSNMFPLICKLFSKEKMHGDYGPALFISPVPCILKDLDKMKIENKHHYAALILMAANNNKLSEEILDNGNTNTNENSFREMKNNFLKKCKVQSNTDTFQFIDALLEMEGTYTKRCCNEFKFIHDSIFEIIAYHFGSKFQELIIQYMSSDYIANKIKIETDNVDGKENESIKSENTAYVDNVYSKTISKTENVLDLCIQLQQSQYPIFVKRLFKDIEMGELYKVFGNEALKHPSVIRSFIKEMQEKSYTEMKLIFLSKTKAISKIWENFYAPKRDDKEEDLLKTNAIKLFVKANPTLKFFMILNEDRCRVRVIDWVIYNGHHHILNYIVGQCLENGQIHDLFQYPNTDKVPDAYTEMGSDINLGLKSDFAKKSDEPRHINMSSSSEIPSEFEIKINSALVAKQQSRLLCIGCLSGDLSTVCILLSHINQENIQDKKQRFDPLVIACKYGYENIVMELLKTKVDINICSSRETPLTAASSEGHLQIVKTLLNTGANVNLNDGDKTPLSAACKGGHANVVEELIKANADVNLSVGNFKMRKYINVSGCTDDVYNPMEYSNAPLLLEDIYKTPLITACKDGYTCIVETLIEAGADVNLSDGYTTPLEIASVWGHLDVVKIMLKHREDKNLKQEMDSALVSACYLGYYKIVIEFLKAGADVNHHKRYATPLKAACLNGHMDLILELIKSRADINLVDENDTPPIAACTGRHNNAFFELLKRNIGVNVNLGTKHYTLLTTAYAWGDLIVGKTILESGADSNIITGPKEIHVRNSTKEKPMLKAGARLKYSNLTRNQFFLLCGTVNMNTVAAHIEAGTDVSLKNVNKTALTSACAGGHLNVVFELIKAGADVNMSDGSKTPLTSASVKGHLKLVIELIKAGAEVNLNDGNKTPLTSASAKGHVEIVVELVTAGAVVNLSDGNKTPLTSASAMGHLELVIKLIKAGAEVNLSDGNKTPLISASVMGHLNIVMELIKSGANASLEYGNRTPLTAACEGGCSNVVVELIKAGADVNQISKEGTPLIIACKYGYENVLKELLKSGANVNLIVGNKTSLATACNQQIKAEANVTGRDEDKTPLLIACERGHSREVKELLKFGADVNLGEKDITPLRAAYNSGNLGLVNLLKKHGAKT